MSSQQPSTLHQQRVVRVFVSSTFRDMHAERDELIKRVFPQLRKLCEERGVTWSEVDLRWGITEEQTQRGEVLPICLAEIQRCRPYFIGLLGERYGWVPDEIPQELLEREAWLAEHLHHSVTELEILHGVLNNPAMADHALFYFRDRAYAESRPGEKRRDFLELPTDEDIAKYGEQEAARRAEERRQKLSLLKERIRQSGFPVQVNYPTPQAVGEMVLHDMKAIIEHLYPKGSEPDPLDRDALEHEAFAQSRAKVYIGRQEYYDRLDEQARGDGLPLVVLGESGSGKSALLANWALRYRNSHSEELLLMHFIGATPYSTDWAAMLRRIMGEFARRFGIEQEIPDQPDALRSTFANWLHIAAARSKVVLVLDAVNQLEDGDSAPDLVWLPPEIPSNIRLIVSALPGRALNDLKKRGWPTMQVKLLEAHERKRLISPYLAQYSKALSPARIDRIVAADQTANPLYLRALLDELRVFGVYEELDARIEHYLEVGTIPEFYKRILERYEEDYERDRAGLVRETMTLLWAARRGLSETELLELLGTDQEPLPQARWSPLYLAAEGSLVSRSGLIGFVHDYLRQAVEDKYVGGEQPQRQAHVKLADYFEGQYLGARKIDEMPWQLAEAKSWQRLCDLLADQPFFTAAWGANEFEVKTYWAKIEAGSPLRMVDAYASLLDAPAGSDYAWLVAMLLADTGHPEEALSLRGYLVDHFRQTGDRANLQACLGGQALILADKGKLDEAMRLHKEQEQICRELADYEGVATALGNQAAILIGWGRLRDGTTLLREQEQICREVGSKSGLLRSLGNQAQVLHRQSNLDEAVTLYKEVEKLCRESGDKDNLAHTLGQLGVAQLDRGDLDAALILMKAEEQIRRELGDKLGVALSLGNQALVLYSRDDLSGALALLREQENTCRALENKEGLANALGNEAAFYFQQGHLDEADKLLTEQEQICRDLEDKRGLHNCLGNRAMNLIVRGDREGAMTLLKEKEEICRTLGDKRGLLSALQKGLMVLKAQGKFEARLDGEQQLVELCRDLEDYDSLIHSLVSQALVLIKMKQPDRALPLATEAYSLARYCREERLIEKTRSVLVGIQGDVGNQAQAMIQRGLYERALILTRQTEIAFRELDETDDLVRSLANQAAILTQMRRPREALPLADEAYRLATQHGLIALVRQIEPILDWVRSKIE
jgi:hypothetical protein